MVPYIEPFGCNESERIDNVSHLADIPALL
jgi:hypothetical protein